MYASLSESPVIYGELEEKRKAFVPPEADYTTKIGLCGSLVSRKKKKELFKSKQVKTSNAKKSHDKICL